MQRTHLFHCTQFDFGPTLRFVRKSPVHGPGANEPLTPRLCCCESVPDCFSARMFHHDRPVYVYRTERPVRGVTPVRVWDSLVTGERWIVHPVPMMKVDTIEAAYVAAVHRPLWYYHKVTGKASNIRLRIATLAMAWDILGDRFEHNNRRRFSERAAKRAKIGDPFEYVREQTQEIPEFY